MTPAARQPSRRRQWVVNRSLQFRFVGVMIFVLCLLTMAALAAVYSALWTTLSLFELLDDPVTVSLFTMVGLIVALQLLLVLPFVVWFGIRLTHRVAGPLVRIQAAISHMASGDFNVHLTLRKGDALPELADAINRLAASLRERAA